MPVNTTHAEYDATLPLWQRMRTVMAGEDAVKAAGELYLPKLDSQTDAEYQGYKLRAAFFNATARTAEGFVGLLFRRDPLVRMPGGPPVLAAALAGFVEDADLLGTPVTAYAKAVLEEVIAVGRCGTLVDWEAEAPARAYLARYAAENILNWRTERVGGRRVLVLVVLREEMALAEGDGFAAVAVEQLRVLRLETVPSPETGVPSPGRYVVEIWQRSGAAGAWAVVERRVPQRMGQALSLIPFVFHGPRNSLPAVDRPPLADVVAVNLDHYRLSADYHHGLHFTALPTAWVSGFENGSELRIGSSTAWVSEAPGAAAGFLEFTGQGLTTFERAMDRAERLLGALGSRMLAEQKRVAESAAAIDLRHSGENSVLGGMAVSVSDSLTQAVRWAVWWQGREEVTDAGSPGRSGAAVGAVAAFVSLNLDFNATAMAAAELTAMVGAWQSGAISHDTLLDALRRGELLPDGRTNVAERELLALRLVVPPAAAGVALAGV